MIIGVEVVCKQNQTGADSMSRLGIKGAMTNEKSVTTHRFTFGYVYLCFRFYVDA